MALFLERKSGAEAHIERWWDGLPLANLLLS
jgi:hypothetical protein